MGEGRIKREDVLNALGGAQPPYDFLVIGGGATGLGVAVDAASRGYRTLLVEQHDFAKGTSSRSTKLIHGGVRYLKQGNISLVLGALKERGLLRQNAPHLVHVRPFVVPIYRWWDGPFYGLGMKLYDRLAGEQGLSPSKVLTKAETLERIPSIEPTGLQRGVLYYDGQFDDARLAVNLAQTIFDVGGSAVNYMRVTGLLKKNGRAAGAVVQDCEGGGEYEVRARVVVNATGVFSDGVRRMDEPGAPDIILASQGAHVVVSKEFLPGESAIMVPRTSDGRVLFAVPWRGHVVVGTTDIPVTDISLEPKPMDEEIGFILTNAARYLRRRPERSDVRSAFAGLRPLVKAGGARETAAMSRDHTILVSESGLVTITGGKWTTYRKMAEDAVNRAEDVAGFDKRPCKTAALRIHGWTAQAQEDARLAPYGADAAAIARLEADDPGLAEPIHPALSSTKAQAVWAVREEMARTVEDVLARRVRDLFLDARAAREAGPAVAAIMAAELGKNAAWRRESAEAFAAVAARHMVM